MIGRACCWVTGALTLLVSAPVTAQQGTKIHMHLGSGYAADGFLYQPAVATPTGGVILIHDARGISDLVRDDAQRLALAGCVVVAIDLYRGRTAGDSQSPAQLGSGLADDDVMHDLNAAIGFLQAQPGIERKPVAAVGWGLGAHYAIKLALASAEVRAIAITAGQLDDAAELTRIKAAVTANLAGPEDPQLASWQRGMHDHGGQADIKFYPLAHAGFFDPLQSGVFRPDDALDAQRRSDHFVVDQLRSDRPGAAITSH